MKKPRKSGVGRVGGSLGRGLGAIVAPGSGKSRKSEFFPLHSLFNFWVVFESPKMMKNNVFFETVAEVQIDTFEIEKTFSLKIKELQNYNNQWYNNYNAIN